MKCLEDGEEWETNELLPGPPPTAGPAPPPPPPPSLLPSPQEKERELPAGMRPKQLPATKMRALQWAKLPSGQGIGPARKTTVPVSGKVASPDSGNSNVWIRATHSNRELINFEISKNRLFQASSSSTMASSNRSFACKKAWRQWRRRRPE